LEALRLFIYVLILIISLVNLINYSTRKSRSKKAAASELSEMRPHRSITPEEIQALGKLHKKEIPLGSEVYRITGPYSSHSLESRNGSVTTHYIAQFEVTMDPLMTKSLLEENSAEVVFLPKNKGALILTMNDKYNAVKESQIRSQLSEAGTAGESAFKNVNTGEASFQKGIRSVTEEERSYLDSDLRILPALGIFLSLLALTFIPGIWAIAAGSVLLLLSLVAEFLPRNPLARYKFKKNIVTVRGKLNNGGIADSVHYELDRFSLVFPRWWQKAIPVDKEVSIEAYPLDKNFSQLKVLSVNSGLSIQMDSMKMSLASHKRFYIFLIIIVINLFFFLSAGEGLSGLNRLYRFYYTRSLQQEFGSLEEISNYDFKEGQEVFFSGIKTIPYCEVDAQGYVRIGADLLVDESHEISLNFDGIDKRLENLEAFQITEDMIGFAAFKASSTAEYYDFLINSMDLANELTIKDFDRAFPGNDEFDFLLKMAEYFFSEEDIPDDPKMDEMTADDITRAVSKFIEKELDILNTMIGRAMAAAIPEMEEELVVNSRDESTMSFSLQLDELTTFTKSRNYLSQSKIEYNSRLGARTSLQKMKSYYSRLNHPVEIAGIVLFHNPTEGLYPDLEIAYNQNYSDINMEYRGAATGVLIILLLVLSVIMIFVGLRDKKE